jgi:hypothetical protein
VLGKGRTNRLKLYRMMNRDGLYLFKGYGMFQAIKYLKPLPRTDRGVISKYN